MVKGYYYLCVPTSLLLYRIRYVYYCIFVVYSTCAGSFEVCCGDPETPNYINIDVPSALALSRFKELEAFPPKEPTRYALRLLAIFFSDEELAKSNCTKAEGRNLLDRRTLDAIRG